jgi:cysteine-rich repeat protein
MSRGIARLAFAAALGLTLAIGLSGAAEAGVETNCGNNVTEPPEECDDGNTVSGDGCSHPSCLPEVCGDGTLNPDPAPGPEEECDDGNTVGDDGCDATCNLECGNGTIEGAEECDTSGQSATCNDDCTLPECGDGNLNEDAGEQCEPPSVGTCDAECQLSTVAQTRGQQSCINGVNGRILGVLRAQNKNSSKCISNVAKGNLTVDQCVGIDVGGKIANAEARNSTFQLQKCQAENVPTFAFTPAATGNAAAKDGALDSLLAVFGDPPTLVLRSADSAAARCQSEVARRHIRLQEAWLAEANKAKKRALKGSRTTPAVSTAAALATAIDQAVEVTANRKLTNAENAVNTGIDRRCAGVTIDDKFDCVGATTTDQLALCVIIQAQRGACLALEQADGLALTCKGDDLP